MKNVISNAALVDRFVRTPYTGRNPGNSMHIKALLDPEVRTMYSYREPIVHIEPGVVWVVDQRFSNTTAQHISHTQQVLRSHDPRVPVLWAKYIPAVGSPWPTMQRLVNQRPQLHTDNVRRKVGVAARWAASIARHTLDTLTQDGSRHMQTAMMRAGGMYEALDTCETFVSIAGPADYTTNAALDFLKTITRSYAGGWVPSAYLGTATRTELDLLALYHAMRPYKKLITSLKVWEDEQAAEPHESLADFA